MVDVLITENKAELDSLLESYSTTYQKYNLILQNPPDTLPNMRSNAEDAPLLAAYAMFIPVPPAGTGTGTASTVGVVADDTPSAQLVTANNRFKAAVANGKNTLNSLYTQINSRVTALNGVMFQANNNRIANQVATSSGASILSRQIDAMNTSYHALQTELLKPIELDGNFEVIQLKTESNFIKYMLYLFFAIFVIGCLCSLYFFPAALYLDMFILSLALIIGAYYCYEYFQTNNVNMS